MAVLKTFKESKCGLGRSDFDRIIIRSLSKGRLGQHYRAKED